MRTNRRMTSSSHNQGKAGTAQTCDEQFTRHGFGSTAPPRSRQLQLVRRAARVSSECGGRDCVTQKTAETDPRPGGAAGAHGTSDSEAGGRARRRQHQPSSAEHVGASPSRRHRHRLVTGSFVVVVAEHSDTGTMASL
jgi:hypothetical protein